MLASSCRVNSLYERVMKFKKILLVLSVMFVAVSCDAEFGSKFEALTKNMLPAIPVGATVTIDKKAYTAGNISRGDIVVFTPSHSKSSYIITRVVGLPGETIEIKGERVIIDGVELNEGYAYYNNARNAIVNDVIPSRIELGRYFVMGDNRYNSADSRHFGAISKQDVKGKIVKIIK